MAQFPVEYLLNKLEALVVGEVKLLKGVGDEVDELKMELRSMKAFLKDADRRKDGDEGIKEWVKQVREVAYDIEDALDEFLLQFGGQQSSGFRASLKKVSSSPSRWITRHQLAKKMQSIKAKVVMLKERQNRYSFKELQEGIAFGGLQDRREAPHDEQLDLVGIDQDITEVIGWLTGGYQQLTPISLVGMGGSGKTTLARKVFNHQAVKRHFECYAWVSVSQSFNVQNILVSCVRDFYKSRSEICPDGIQEMEETAMPKLQILWIIGCKEMKRVPRGIQHINTIRQLILFEMPEELIDSIERHGGKDHSMVKHIPEIFVGYQLEDGTRYGKYL